jgi:molecular chaperone GrpE
MVHKQLLDALAKHGVEPIAALGQPFDPNQHEALVQQPSADHPEGTVVAELGKGYRLRDRILRPAKVVVSVRPNPAPR